MEDFKERYPATANKRRDDCFYDVIIQQLDEMEKKNFEAIEELKKNRFHRQRGISNQAQKKQEKQFYALSSRPAIRC
jgi:hypothetical protein